MEDIYQVLELHLQQTILCLAIHGEPGSNNFKDKYLVGENVIRITFPQKCNENTEYNFFLKKKWLQLNLNRKGWILWSANELKRQNITYMEISAIWVVVRQDLYDCRNRKDRNWHKQIRSMNNNNLWFLVPCFNLN